MGGWRAWFVGACVLGALVAGCGTSAPSLDAGTDGGAPGRPDGGAAQDGGSAADAGTPRDGGAIADGGAIPPDGSAASDAGTPACVNGYSDLQLRLNTAGGFWGNGDYDYVATRQAITIVDKHRNRQCSSVLSGAQGESLLGAAARVDWASVRTSYIPPDNPNCCCDQIVYALEATVTICDGGTRSAQTTWCEEATHDGTLPDSLFGLLRALLNIARDVLTGC